MAMVGQSSLTLGWSAFDQKQLTQLAVAGQAARSGYVQKLGTADYGLAGPAVATVEKLRTAASGVETVKLASHSPKKATSDEHSAETAADGGATEYMRNQLRNGEDGEAKIIQGLEQTLQAHKENVKFAKETIKIYQETGEVLSVQPNGNFKIDLSVYGGEDGYMKRMREVVEGSEKYTIPDINKSIEGLKTSRMERMREYGLIPPALDANA